MQGSEVNDTSCEQKQLGLAELRAAHAKAMQNAEHLQSGEADPVILATQPHHPQAGTSSVLLDISPLVQRTDVSHVAHAKNSPAASEDSQKIDDFERACHASATGSEGGTVQSDRARRTSIFQQTAVGIKTIVQMATGSNQAAPALFEEVLVCGIGMFFVH